MTDDRYVVRGAFTLIGVLIVAFAGTWLGLAAVGHAERWPVEGTAILIGLTNLLVGLLGGRAILSRGDQA